MNQLTRRNALKMISLAVPGAMAATRALAQDAWPDRSVRILMGFSAGGGADSMARPVFQSVSEALGQTMVVENRTGGNSVIAAQAALQVPADGYVFFLNGLQHLVNPILVEDIPFDYATSFVPVSQLCSYPQTFAVATDAPWKTMEDLIDYARKNPGKVRYGTAGIGGVPHILGELLKLTAKVDMVNIPYTNAPDIATDVAGGRLDMSILTTSTIGPMMRAGKVRILAVGNKTRSKLYPDVPTMEEVGLAEANLSDWTGLFAPTGTADDVVQKMQAAVALASKDQKVIGRVEPQGTILIGSTSKEFGELLDQQRKMVKYVIEAAHITLN